MRRIPCSKGKGKGLPLDIEAGQTECPLILSLDTSSKRTSIGLAHGGRVLALFGAELDERRSEQLWKEIDFLLAESGVGLGEIGLFSACTGPGGFTGLRVGLAAIKGFAAAGDRRVAGVTSLEALAFSASVEGRVLALVNAYKGDYYFQLFRCRESDLPVAEAEPSLASPEEIARNMVQAENLVLIGEGAAGVIETSRAIRQGVRGGATDSWSIKAKPDFLADIIARVAFLKFSRGDVFGPDALHACYVRPSDAEVKLSLGLVGRGLK